MAGRAAPIVYRTINELLIEAAGRDPDKIWLRTDDVELTFAEALAAIGGRAPSHGRRHRRNLLGPPFSGEHGEDLLVHPFALEQFDLAQDSLLAHPQST